MGKTVELSAYQLGAIIADSTGRFCRSAQKEPDTRHIQVSDMLDDRTADEFKAFILPHVKRHWEECLSRDSRAGISPDVYLKVWELSQPIIHADFLLCDEMPE